MDLIATAAHASSVPVDNPFMIAIIVAAAGVTAAMLALLGAFGLVITGRAE